MTYEYYKNQFPGVLKDMADRAFKMLCNCSRVYFCYQALNGCGIYGPDDIPAGWLVLFEILPGWDKERMYSEMTKTARTLPILSEEGC